MSVSEKIHVAVCDCAERVRRDLAIAGLDPEVVFSPENIKAIIERVNAAFDEVHVCVLYNTPEEEIVIRVGPFRAVVSLSELKTEGGASIDPECEGSGNCRWATKSEQARNQRARRKKVT